MQTKTIDMLMSSKIASLRSSITICQPSIFAVKATKVNDTEPLFVDKPNYLALIERYLHLKGVTVNDHDTKASLPVHLVLNSGEYARIKTETKPRIEQENDPITELTKFGWFLMPARKEFGKISCF